MDLTVYTRRPEREHTCPGCRAWRDGIPPAEAPDHVCRTAPAVPQDRITEQNQADDQVLAQREGSVRAIRLAEIRRGAAG